MAATRGFTTAFGVKLLRTEESLLSGKNGMVLEVRGKKKRREVVKCCCSGVRLSAKNAEDCDERLLRRPPVMPFASPQ